MAYCGTQRKPSALAQAKVKLVADAVWSKLTGAFSKDVLHAQVGSIGSAAQW